jgi:hypothetical protein
VRDGETEELSVELFFAIQKPEEFNNAPHCQGHAVGILPVCNIKRRRTALHFACKERKVHEVGCHEERNI